MEYIALLHKDKNSDFGVSFPDFPGCVTAGKTLEETRKKAEEVLSFHIAGMEEDGEKIPQPSTLDYLEKRRRADLADAVIFLANIPSRRTKARRINITIPESQVATIDKHAAAAGMSRSAYMVQAATIGMEGRFHKAAKANRSANKSRR